MSKGIRRPTVKTPFEAKRVIVAACAAIAMVLGTMSVSSTVSSPDSPAQTGEVSAIINSEASKQKRPASTDFSRKHTLEVRNFLQQQDPALYNTPNPTAAASKNARKPLLPVFSIVSPIFFINQITQSAQTETQLSAEAPAASDANDAEAGLPTSADDPAGADNKEETAGSESSESEGTDKPDQPDEDRSVESTSTPRQDTVVSE